MSMTRRGVFGVAAAGLVSLAAAPVLALGTEFRGCRERLGRTRFLCGDLVVYGQMATCLKCSTEHPEVGHRNYQLWLEHRIRNGQMGYGVVKEPIVS